MPDSEVLPRISLRSADGGLHTLFDTGEAGRRRLTLTPSRDDQQEAHVLIYIHSGPEPVLLGTLVLPGLPAGAATELILEAEREPGGPLVAEMSAAGDDNPVREVWFPPGNVEEPPGDIPVEEEEVRPAPRRVSGGVAALLAALILALGLAGAVLTGELLSTPAPPPPGMTESPGQG